MSDNPFNASWSSKGNTLCLGHWDISYLGLPVVLPIERRDKDMEQIIFIILWILKMSFIEKA